MTVALWQKRARPLDHWRRRAFVAAAAVLATVACRRDDTAGATPSPSPRPEPIVFRQEARAEDPAVNDFVIHAIRTCIAGDYPAFRLLWSARQEPLSEAEFRRGWRAVEKVTIHEIRKMKTPEGEVFYAVRGEVDLNPSEVPHPNRNVVLVLVEENGRWRLATAPRQVRAAMLPKEAGTGDADSTGITTSAPAGDQP